LIFDFIEALLTTALVLTLEFFLVDKVFSVATSIVAVTFAVAAGIGAITTSLLIFYFFLYCYLY